MIRSIKIFLPNGKEIDLEVGGKSGITKIFTDREIPNTVVVLTENGIFQYGNVTYVAEKDYAEKKA